MCAQTLPFGQTAAKNPAYFLQMIWDMAKYANQLIRLSNKGNFSHLYIWKIKVHNSFITAFCHVFPPISLPISPGLTLGSKAQTGILQYEAVELIFCLSFLLVLSQHRPLYKDLLSHLHKRMYPWGVHIQQQYHIVVTQDE